MVKRKQKDMIFIIVFLIYIVGVFASIALTTWIMSDYAEEDVTTIALLSAFSWIFIAAILLMFIIGIVWEYVIKYPFVWFYNKCNEKFRNK